MINFVSYAVVHTEMVRRDDLICMFVTSLAIFLVGCFESWSSSIFSNFLAKPWKP